MLRKRLAALAVLIVGLGFGWFVYSSQVGGWRPFVLGLDLSGGTRLEYTADTSKLASGDIAGSMAALRDTIERRVNAFGVSEPVVQTERGGLTGQGDNRLTVELPGVTDTQEAIDLIGKTPVLDFRLLTAAAGTTTPSYVETGLTGQYLQKATLQFSQGTAGALSNEPTVVLTFNAKGRDMFAKITGSNVGKTLGIFLDDQPISTPVITEAIPDGNAVISGSLTPDAAKTLVQNLNFGALPVPITLLSTQTIGSTLGDSAVARGISAGMWGVIFVMIFMILWYRLPGVIAALALSVYIVVMLAVFKLLPVTLSAAGIAGFILSVGMAVDANILIFERMREEFAEGKGTQEAIHEGFARAWPSIRDSNLSSIITSIILFWFGTSLVKGFALVLGIGVVASMLTAVSASRSFLYALGLDRRHALARFLYGSGRKSHI